MNDDWHAPSGDSMLKLEDMENGNPASSSWDWAAVACVGKPCLVGVHPGLTGCYAQVYHGESLQGMFCEEKGRGKYRTPRKFRVRIWSRTRSECKATRGMTIVSQQVNRS
jgi:hypothetical protein